MKTQLNWKKLLFTLTLWLMAEIVFTALGIDNIADYGEFVLNRSLISSSMFVMFIA
ncbi:MAG: hypothetical protein AB4058_10690 [Microcystaceae cyanobacterium]